MNTMNINDGQHGRDINSLKSDLQMICMQGGINTELYRAVGDWQNMVTQNNGQYIKGDINDRDWPEMVESLKPLLLGVEDAGNKAVRYFRDFDDLEKIGDEKFAQRARLWETMGTYMDQGGIVVNGERITDIASVVLKVIQELDPSIIAELSEDHIDIR